MSSTTAFLTPGMVVKFVVRTENMNWHFANDGARSGQRLALAVGGGTAWFWHYIKKQWQLYGFQPSVRA